MPKIYLMLCGVIALAGCQPSPRSVIIGEWTPDTVNDCSQNGVTLTFTNRDVVYHSNKSTVAIMRVSKIVDDGPIVDLDVQARKYDLQNPDQWNPMETIRFQVSDGTAKIVGVVSPGGEVRVVQHRGMEDIFSMRRCE